LQAWGNVGRGCYTSAMNKSDTPLIGHRSFSSFTSWLRCGKAWQLERGQAIQGDPAWWFVGGSAFHEAVEKYLLATLENNGEERA